MEKDTKWESFFSQNHRFADIINGLGCEVRQLIRPEDLSEQDGKTGKGNRDVLRKAALGMNFIIIGIENQDKIDYRMPFRNMVYDVHKYKRQFLDVYHKVRENPEGLTKSEYLCGFKKDSKVHPVITFVLYSGETPWDGATSLHELIDFTDVPESLKAMVQDYKIHVFDIRRFEHSEVFQTDVKQVFDFIRISENKEALRKLVENDAHFRHMDADAFEVIASYTDSKELTNFLKQDERGKGEKINMCKAIKDLMADSRADGMIEERSKIILCFLSNHGTEADAMKMLNVTKEDIETAKRSTAM